MYHIDDNCIKAIVPKLGKEEPQMLRELINEGFYHKEVKCTCGCNRTLIIESEYLGENQDIMWEIYYK